MSLDLYKARVINSKEEEREKAEKMHKEDFEYSKNENINSENRLSWRAPEYEVYEKSATWYLASGIFILAIVVYAMFKDSPIMAITFVLIGVVGYIYLQKEPREIEFVINYEGIRAGRDLYDFENIKSFWIFYDPPHTKTLSLHVEASMVPFVHIPIENEDPVKIRELLLDFIPEVKQENSLVDAFGRFLHI